MRWVGARAEDATLAAITLAGLGILLTPLLVRSSVSQSTALLTALIALAALLAVGIALQTRQLSARLLAILAALIAVDAALRLVIVVGLLGFSPIFFLIIAGGYVMGPAFGFSLGALTLLLSAVLTAGFGPWLPYQMLGCGWVGMGAGYLAKFRSPATAYARRPLWTVVWLGLYGAVAGFGYGLLLDLWEWPLLLGAASSSIAWAPGLSPSQLALRFATFYLTTSFVYDSFRAAGNVALVWALGAPVIGALHRFRRRFLVQWSQPPEAVQELPIKIANDVGTPA
jgi:energy-coupling factor transport system substrate-specific component